MKYIILGEEFDDAAKYLATLQKNIDIGKKKAAQYNKEAKVNINRLSIFIKNQFFRDYKFTEHCILFRRDGKIEFQYYEDVDLAKKKHEEFGKKNSDWTEELDFFGDPLEGFVVSLGHNDPSDDLEEYYKDYDDMKKYLPKPVKRCKIEKEQKEELKELFFACDHPKLSFILDKMDSFQSEYLDVVDDVLDNLSDSDIDFDITCDKLITVRDDKDMSWHLVIEHEIKEED